MTQQLRDELARLADGAPAIDVPTDTWSRGRRARRTDRVAAGAAVLVVLAVLGGVTALFSVAPDRIAPAAPVDGPYAVPSTLFTVPTHVQADPTAYTSDLAVGDSAVAFVTDRGTPVVVSATDGSYRLLDLPGWERVGDAGPARPLALSPDGRQLAWAYLDADGATGVRVADLESGTLREVPVVPADEPGPQQVVVAVTWSTGSSWLAWASGVVGREGWVATGRIAPDADRTDPTNVQPGTSSLAVDDSGRQVLAQENYVFVTGGTYPGAGFDPLRPLDPTAVGATSPDGTRVAVGSASANGAVDVLDLDRMRVRLAYFGAYDQDASHSPLGWVDDDTIVIAVEPPDRDPEVLVLPAPGNRRDGERVVTRTDADQNYLSVAVDLLDRPTVERAEPDWPWSTTTTASLAAGAAVTCLLALGLALWTRRRPG
jgi:hypothetical protein